jgi:hypothetical protein
MAELDRRIAAFHAEFVRWVKDNQDVLAAHLREVAPRTMPSLAESTWNSIAMTLATSAAASRQRLLDGGERGRPSSVN